MLSESLVASDPGWTVPQTAAAAAPRRDTLPRAAHPCCSIIVAAVGLSVQQAGLWSLYSDFATLCGITGVVLVLLASLVVEIGRLRRSGCGGPGCVCRAASWLGVFAFALLTWRGTVLSAAWCPASDYTPSPGNSTATVPTVTDRWDYPTVQGVVCHTTAGDLEILLREEWSPLGVAHFLQLVSAGFFTEAALFRVVTGRVSRQIARHR